eukprot:TRINITY_DN714_c0_g1_i1.p1 TRINITY_DN714_c0_g1~~TRINITY_DN714_c0_g1_i1.p1  ORF type:complete len:492 (-),score=131.99 TRINITY_DN714_c0_g1_i1:981-2261(-)
MDGSQGCGSGMVDISLWNPSALNTDSWMENAQAMGCQYAVYVAKHSCGFVAWPSQVDLYGYNYSILYSPVPKVDVVGSFVQSAKKYGMRYGFYYSTVTNWYCNVHGGGIVSQDALQPGMLKVTQEQYNEIVIAHLKELWGNYGALTEVWFDGGYNPDMKQQFLDLFDNLQPQVIAFQGQGLTKNCIRWIGNEDGEAYDPTWSAGEYPNPGAGDPNATTWYPAETDFTLQQGDQWFYNKDIAVRSPSELRQKYERSVGRNTNAIIDFAPFANGTIPQDQQKAAHLLGEFVRECYKSEPISIAKNVKSTSVKLSLPSGIDSFDRIVIREDQTNGQFIRNYMVKGLTSSKTTVTLSSGSSVGNCKIDLVNSATTAGVTEVELTIVEAIDIPVILEFSIRSCSALAAAHDKEWESIRKSTGRVHHIALTS